MKTGVSAGSSGTCGHPVFSWQLLSSGRNCLQDAYRIRCAGDRGDLVKAQDLLWDTHRINTDQSLYIAYKGKDLQSGQKIFWQVKAWNNLGEESEWSDISTFQVGMLNSDEWCAKWIEPGFKEEYTDSGPCPFLRREFTIKKEVSGAIIYITSRGLYELSINGKKIGDQLFTPGWTSYHRRLQYQVYDISNDLRQGENTAGVILADGWYRGYLGWQGKRNFYGDTLSLLFQLEVTYMDGSKDIICSDSGWRSGTGPLLRSDIYMGETYDARLEIPGWDHPGFDDSSWNPVNEKDYGYENLVCSTGEPVRHTGEIKPVKKIVTPLGENVLDFGQNLTGRVQIELEGKKGSRIIIHHAEVLDGEGNFYTENLRNAKAEDIYIFKGGEKEIYEPLFTFHGFRYIRISEYDSEITGNEFIAKVLHSDVRITGSFKCSDELVNQLQSNILWGLMGNFLDVPTDCPQRDERMGWTGDAQVFAPTACFNVDAEHFYRKWLRDLAVDQKENGSVPWVVPNVVVDGEGTGWSDGYGATGWADAAVIIPWVLYQVYGDRSVLEAQYKSMKAWVEYMIGQSGDSFIFSSGFHFGDWLSFAEYYSYNYNAPDYGYAGAHTDKVLIATAYFFHSTGIMKKTADVLGKKEDSERYSAISLRIKEAFQREFITGTGRLVSGTQTAYVLSLSFGLIPDDLKTTVARRFADDVRYFGHLTTGFLGTPLICQALSDNGYFDLACMLLFNRRYPSWLYPVTMGATTIWERWDGIKPDGSFQDTGMNSFNHYAYGAVGNWLYTYLAGIMPDESFPGYKRIMIKPFICRDLDYVEAEYSSVHGRIRSSWNREGDRVTLEIGIPVNTRATIALPCNDPELVKENGNVLKGLNSFLLKGVEEGRTIVETGSGDYIFTFPLIDHNAGK